MLSGAGELAVSHQAALYSVDCALSVERADHFCGVLMVGATYVEVVNQVEDLLVGRGVTVSLSGRWLSITRLNCFRSTLLHHCLCI